MKTPLHCAVSQRHVDVVTALINAKAKIDQKDDVSEETLILCATGRAHCLVPAVLVDTVVRCLQ